MKDIDVKETMQEMMLRQMGAEVTCFLGKQCFVKFNINGYEITYTYNINLKNKYFLQRIKPYPMSAGVFENLKDVVEMIQIDVEQFTNVIKSGKFDKFLEINTKILEAARNLEDLFLYYKVDEAVFDVLLNQIDIVKKKISENAISDKRVYFKKDPETL
ncbi:hypothetical protein SAMN05443428_10358 [Caloramator quimbayensis]|uniref:Uncharacterized protein n=1 Tax=Caloramator quimbayensis TaxID=1147123 RepID=A0A1T4WQM8_9CLOT|nr:hypothetical protein [Caloramator quimbayensis]SKA79417.1 hypothetical protein SAMN05443428_10358 [Caloramator quimbayensis]